MNPQNHGSDDKLRAETQNRGERVGDTVAAPDACIWLSRLRKQLVHPDARKRETY